MLKRSSNWLRIVFVAAALASVPSWSRAQTAAAPADSGASVRSSDEDRARLKEVLGRMGRREVEGERQWERRKSGKVAMYSSALLPGLGQVYNGRRLKVAVMVGVASGYIAQIWLNTKAGQRARAERDRLDPGTRAYNFQNDLSAFYEEEARTWGWWTGAIWIIGILDAWTDAHLYDIRAYKPPSGEELSGSLRQIPAEGPVRYITFSVGF